MKISKGLKELRKYRNELNRLVKIRSSNFYAIIPKDSTLSKEVEEGNVVNFEEVTERINELLEKINDLRERILRTNVNTMVETEEGEISLAKLLLTIGKYKSELAHFENFGGIGGYFGRERRISTAEEEQLKVPYLDDMELEEKIKDLEEKKIELESKLEYINATTEILQ
jgi:hypothetical protein